MNWRVWLCGILLCILWGWGCGNTTEIGPDGGNTTDEPTRVATKMVLRIPAGGTFTTENFYDMPYPHDLRLDPDGTPALAGLPLPRRTEKCEVPTSNEPLIASFLKSIDPDSFIAERLKLVDKHTTGFGLYSAIYLQFARNLDAKSIPTPDESITADAKIFLMDIDPNSKERGRRIPIEMHPGYNSRFFPAPLVAVRPYEGFPLRPKTRYALVFRKGVLDIDGKELVAPDDFQRFAKNDALPDATEEKVRKIYAPMFAYLQSDHQIAPDEIVAATVFTTGDPLHELKRLRDILQTYRPDPPKTLQCRNPGQQASYIDCRGTYMAPQFQKGKSPFIGTDTGYFYKNEDGSIGRTIQELRFTLSVPKRYTGGVSVFGTSMPIVMYAHGTGGSYETPIQNGTAERLAKEGIATIGLDQPVHGARVPPAFAGQGWIFFNPLNFLAARDNIRQAALDYVYLRLFLKQLRLTVNNKPLNIDTKRIWFMGHSQGALIGGVFVSVEKELQAAFLSAPSGALIHSFLPAPNRPPDHPNNVTPYVDYLICDKKAPKIDHFHPLPNLVQHLYDAADPVGYLAQLLQDESHKPLNLFMTQGTTDTYTPPQVFNPVATALGAPMFGKELLAIPSWKLRKLPREDFPVQGNLTHPNGTKITVGFSQHNTCKRANGSACDGHFVTFNNPDAVKHWTSFFQSLLTQTTPKIQ